MLDYINGIKLFAFDLDGTLYTAEKAMYGAIDVVKYLQTCSRVVYFTNNSSKTVNEIHKKLNKLGFLTNFKNIYTSSSAAADYLRAVRINNVFVIGSKGLKEELLKADINISQNEKAKNLLVGLDFDFNYDKIAIALNILRNGGKFVACNEDRSFPVENDRLLPGCGAMVGAISAVSGRKPDFIIGKPNTYILEQIARDYGVNRKQVIVVGDSFESDIRMALNFGCRSILIGNKKINNSKVKVIKKIGQLKQIIRRPAA
jgi:HAD superfamily hydrolase (TIGR01450 family)